MNEKESIKYDKKKFFNYEIEEYINWKDFIEVCEETYKTAKELKKEKMKWEKFKFLYRD
jgi:hypothetical protein